MDLLNRVPRMFLLLAGLFFGLQVLGCLLMFENKNDKKTESNSINYQKDDDVVDDKEDSPLVLKCKINSLGLA